jgi:hypothetical protein
MRRSAGRVCAAIGVVLWVASAEPGAAQGVASPAGQAGVGNAGPDSAILHHRHRARRTRSAVADSTVLLQVEAGYDGNFQASELTRDQSSGLSVVVTPTSRIVLQADVDAWASQQAPQQRAMHGHGDTRLTLQYTLRTGRPGQVSIGVAYEVKLPTARPDSLGSGRVDHRLLPLISFSSRRFELDLTAGVDANGLPGGLDWGAEGAVTFTLPISHQVTAHVAWSGQTIDTDQPAGHYASAGATWQLSRLLGLDVGGRLGLSPSAPAFGFTAGVTAAILPAL